MPADLITRTAKGLFCPPGNFYIDPWRAVDRAVITHAHADHARTGHGGYLASARSEQVLRARLGASISLQCTEWGESVDINGVKVSLHPASHVLGAAQVRVEHRGEVWVASGDYRVESDLTCDDFESVRCDTFITESTFGLPVYRWLPQQSVFDGINDWWQQNADNGIVSTLFCYSFGKAQRILAGINPDIGPIICHSAVKKLNDAYEMTGVALPQSYLKSEMTDKLAIRRALVVAPPSAAGGSWMRGFGSVSDAFASGWMQIRGARRRRSLDRGFVLSDHADWPGLQSAIKSSGASRVIVTHGYEAVMVRWLQEQGLQAGSFKTEFGTEDADRSHDVTSSG